MDGCGRLPGVKVGLAGVATFPPKENGALVAGGRNGLGRCGTAGRESPGGVD